MHQQPGVTIAWLDDEDKRERTAFLGAGFIARGGVQLGYAMTTHKAEGLTVSADWTRPDGTEQHGTVLVDLTGMDNAGVYVSTSRHRGQLWAYAPRKLVESLTSQDLHGQPTNQVQRQQRVQTALAATAVATRDSENDTPVTPQPPARPALRSGDLAARLAEAREAGRRVAEAESAPRDGQTAAERDSASQRPAPRPLQARHRDDLAR